MEIAFDGHFLLAEFDMVIRTETEADFGRIYELVKVAFQTARVASGDEQNFVNRLRAGENYLPELALAAEEQGRVIGHVMLTKTFFLTGETRHDTLLLAPLSVELEFRNRGIGGQLVLEVFRRAVERGHRSVFLVGDPAYYARFGFKPTVHWNIKNTQGIPDENVMARELVPGTLEGLQGTITFEH